MNQSNKFSARSFANSNAVDLNYFIELLESRPIDTPDHSAAKWDRRAEVWEKERMDSKTEKNDNRIQNTGEYLQSRGLLLAEHDVADIGCGPGRFAVEFARTAHSVTGFDISEQMVRYGLEHARREGLQNVTLRACDFQTLDIEKEGLVGAFDLAFSSLTPAIHGMNGLTKSMRMSRGYCCHITHLRSANQLKRRMMQEVFHREPPARWNGRWFYALFNVLFLMGYYPEVTYYDRHEERRLYPDADYVELFMEHMLSPRERTRDNEARIWQWFRTHADEDGAVMEVSDTCCGRLLWDVRDQTQRPDYRSEIQEG